MTLMFFIAAALAWAVDRFLSGFDLYRFFWHPALLRLSLFGLSVRRDVADCLPLRTS